MAIDIVLYVASRKKQVVLLMFQIRRQRFYQSNQHVQTYSKKWEFKEGKKAESWRLMHHSDHMARENMHWWPNKCLSQRCHAEKGRVGVDLRLMSTAVCENKLIRGTLGSAGKLIVNVVNSLSRVILSISRLAILLSCKLRITSSEVLSLKKKKKIAHLV